ncbi:hypothetical protein HMPREF0063_10605 [Aeromicrobium marinum DSM 15272]|uniref:HNH nuclease domain-containing protein n=1 Tax=Aeromicrobium marinum DSM 15272 TaxID=585531 RepID=E2S9G5_9ACTN|nr:HNH endonuclease signature motif containing protein [Aeromicrobium marinum]EFQ83889.1 hypothetical protein HMPREF0063_10605 [Aeromicrobium marinum DSM 15272]
MDSGTVAATLRGAADALTRGDDREVLVAIQAAQDALDAAKVHHLAAVQRTAGFELDGASAMSTWARTHLRLPAQTTRKLLAADSTLRDLPEAAEAGRIRADHVAVFTYGIRHIGRSVVREAQSWLLDVAVTHEPVEFRRVMQQLREAVFPESLDQAWADGMEKEDLQVNPVPMGWHVNGFLSTVTGAKLRAVLDSIAAPTDAEDRRTGAERRVDALDTLVSKVLESGLPSDKGIRPHLSVIADADTLAAARAGAGPAGTPAQLAGFGSIGPQLLSYLGCISDLTAIMTTTGDLTQARVLNVGRTRRLATLQQRRAIIARQDGVCAAPGCANTHLEIHHATWWENGGRTDLDQMVGLCTRCHHLVHRNLLRVAANGTGQFDFTDHDHRPLHRAYRQRVAAHRETARIRRTLATINTRRAPRNPPLRV